MKQQVQYIILKLLVIIVISLCFSSKADAEVTTELRNNGSIFKITGTGCLNIGTNVTGIEETYVLKSTAGISNSEYAFSGSRNLKKVHLNNKLGEIKEGAFKNSNIKSINIPYSVKYIGAGCFEGCGNLETVNNKLNLSEIYNYTFRNCTSLKEINLNSSVSKIAGHAFENCGAMFNVAADSGYYTSKNGILYSDVFLIII